MDNLKGIIALIFSVTLFTYSFAFDQTPVNNSEAGDIILPSNAVYNGFIAENTSEYQYDQDLSFSGADSVNDPYYTRQWALIDNNLPKISDISEDNPVIVAVLDTGIDSDHEDLKGQILQEINLNGTNSPDDVKGHGTHIAGIIGARADNGIGISGIAPGCYLLNVKVTNDNGRCDAAALSEGIIWAADHGANIINISITINESYSKLEEAVNYAWNKGCIIVSAAANETINPVYPACYVNSIPVIATNDQDVIMPLVYQKGWVQLAAPGFNIYSTLPDNRYGYWGGTSFAAAYVSGISALLFGIAEDTNGNGNVNDEIRKAIEDGATESQDGFKRINLENSVKLLTSGR